MGHIVVVGNVQPAENGKAGFVSRFYLERENHEITVINRMNPYLDEFLQVISEIFVHNMSWFRTVGQFRSESIVYHIRYSLDSSALALTVKK